MFIVAGSCEQENNDLVLSFLSLRRAIGVLGLFLPFALALYGLATDAVLTSMSAYYYSPMREVFVGTLCALAVFFWSYEGYRNAGAEVISDKGTARVAAVSVALVALAPIGRGAKLPADARPESGCTLIECLLGAQATTVLHIGAAGTFFGALAVYCLVLFVRGGDDSSEKRAAKVIYRVCGVLIILCIVPAGLLELTGLDQISPPATIFWLEAVATVAFAVSWLVKGRSARRLVDGVASIC
ncbi:MAG: hypothetical protein ACK5L9_14720 [Paracoccus sp. (in: a-proteobacteria)]